MNGGDPIATAIGAIVNAGDLAGAATLVWRDDKVLQTACVGWRDLDARLPIERDTIFRIASMSKPITSTLALMLHNMLELGQLAKGIGLGVYFAITQFQALASAST